VSPNPETGAEIELSHVSKTYAGAKGVAVEDLSMVIPAEQCVVLVGPSGCGKTTTMKMINRIIEPTSGRITIGGVDVETSPAAVLRRSIGYVIQQIGLFPNMTVRENVATVPRLLKWDKQRVAARVNEMLELVGLDPTEYAARYPKQLSGGQQQRVGVARALAGDPAVLLMDEPFGATDPITRVRLQTEFRSLQMQLKKTVVFVTHDFDEALLIGDRIAILGDRSRIEQYGTPLEILANPANDHVRSFVGDSAHVRLLGLIQLGAIPHRPSDGGADTSLPHTAAVRESVDRFLTGSTAVAVLADDGTVLGHVTFADVQDAIQGIMSKAGS
jgi:osmoprotectant transport system ATP-binding protein